jgi:hypothetical protein
MNQTTPLEFATRQGADAMARFPTSSHEDKERRALKAALHVAELKRELSTVTAVRLDMLRIAWACASEDARQEFCQQLRREGLLS